MRRVTLISGTRPEAVKLRTTIVQSDRRIMAAPKRFLCPRCCAGRT
jgi:hypothetical protein